MSSFTHDNAFAFQTKVHLFASPSRQLTLNSALQRALKHYNNACSTTKGSISTWPIDAPILSDRRRRWNSKKNQFSKQTGYTLNISISDDGQKTTILNSFLARLTYQISHLGKTQPSVDLVFKTQSHELRMPLHFPKQHDEVLSPESKDTLKDITQALVLC